MNDDAEDDSNIEDFPDPAGMATPGDRYRLTDVGNANRFADRHGKNVRWCASTQGDGLLVWDGNRWHPDETQTVLGLAQAVALDVYQDSLAAAEEVKDLERMAKGEIPCDDPTTLATRIKGAQARAKALAAWAKASEMSPRLNAMVAVALPGVAVRQKQLDADPFLFAAYGETYDLRTGKPRGSRRTDLITRLANVTPDPHAGCPTWLEFLYRIMGADRSLPDDAPVNVQAAETVAFLQRAIGYSLTGSIKEQVMFVCYGATGGNGKSTFLDTICDMMGDYACITRAETFMRSERKSTIPNDLAALDGRRFVKCSEPDQGAILDDALIKEMTGDAKLSVRFLNREFFDLLVKFKAWMATNHRPIVRGTSRAIWRRLMLIPFEVAIPEAEWDRNLLDKLAAERPGILAWAIQGCLMWQHGTTYADGRKLGPGLHPPPHVLAAKEAYRADMDVLGDFIADRCVVGPYEAANNTDLYRAFQSWQKDQGEIPRAQRWFSRALQDRGFKQAARRDQGRRWEGIGLRPEKSASTGYRHPDDPGWQ